MSVLEAGRVGEEWALGWLQKQGFKCFQMDWIAYQPNPSSGTYLGIEVKNQERFVAPPFDGHGLPRWQVEARLRFQREVGVRVALVVHDKGTGEIFWQFLDTLETGEHHDTFGFKPRRIYPLGAFNKDMPLSPIIEVAPLVLPKGDHFGPCPVCHDDIFGAFAAHYPSECAGLANL
jgi:GNAT superfamily N-acetyltransferase